MSSDTFNCQVLQVVFRASDSGFAVLRVEVIGEGARTLCGTLAHVLEGERLEVLASPSEHPQYGRRWQVESAVQIEPDDRASRRAFLCSLEGIGESRADTLLDRYGDDVLERIDERPEAIFSDLPGVGKKIAAKAARSWRDRREIRSVIQLLAAAKITEPHVLANRIVGVWGSDTLELLRADPFDISHIAGVTFRDADLLAAHFELPPDGARRKQAAARHLVGQAHAKKGHMYLTIAELSLQMTELLQLKVDPADLELVLPEAPGLVVDDGRVYASHAHQSESYFAADILSLASKISALPRGTITDAGAHLSDAQRRAVEACWWRQLVTITGPPGVGKTTVIKALVAEAKARNVSIALVAPTGKAAKRLAEASGHPASTVHRLLGLRGQGSLPEHSGMNPLSARVVICDEASMLDIDLAGKLTDALGEDAHLVLVGDPDQLPAPGAGEAFAEVLASPWVVRHRLKDVFRQAAKSTLLKAVAEVREGRIPAFETALGGTEDFRSFWSNDEDELCRRAVEVARVELPEMLGVSPDEIQVIAPMYKGAVGIDRLNELLRDRANPDGTPVMGGRLRCGDRLIQTKTDYTLTGENEEPFVNGSFCFLSHVEANFKDPCLVTTLEDGRRLEVPTSKSGSLKLGYAISVHKAQGSEWPGVVVVLPPAPRSSFLTRRLLRTALTRARGCCYLVADPDTFAAAVGRSDQGMRNCAASERVAYGAELEVRKAMELAPAFA